MMKPTALNGGQPEIYNRGAEEGGSIFDPVLCEIIYSWFCPPKGKILDPFAGGSVRGIVAGSIGRKYTGIDLRAEQIEENKKQSIEVGRKVGKKYIKPQWFAGDSFGLIKLLGKKHQFDFMFSCPPYGDLEKYSDDPLDLSNMDSEKFIIRYREVIKQGVSLLKTDSFCCFVVGDYRDKEGFYECFIYKTIQAFLDCGAKLYNEAVFLTSVGSLPIMVGKMFSSSRKLGKTHQNILIFCKGNPKKATAKLGEVEIDIDLFKEFTDDI